MLQAPEWKQYGWLVHGFSTRLAGVSTIYGTKTGCGELGELGELNLGFTATDARENVVENRRIFLRAILPPDGSGTRKASRPVASNPELPRSRLTLLRQIHSGLVHHLDAQTEVERRNAVLESLPRGDGAIATEPGVILGILTADCIPVLVADVRQRIVGAFHAGWRGTLSRVVERGVGRMRAEFGSRPADLTAAIGPGIGRCCYSVGEEVRAEFQSQFAYADALFEEVFNLDPIKEKYPMLFLTARAPGHSNLGPSLHLDLAEANRRQLLDAGLRTEAIHSLADCTACDTKRFFSHRAEHGFTGRMLSVIGTIPTLK